MKRQRQKDRGQNKRGEIEVRHRVEPDGQRAVKVAEGRRGDIGP